MTDWTDAELERELAATDDLLVLPMAHLAGPPADLGARTQTRAAEALMRRSVLGTAADLLGVGWQTMRILFGEDEHEDEDDRPALAGHDEKEERR